MPAAGGDGGQGLEEVQGAALAAEQGAGRAFEVEQGLVGVDALAVAYLPVHGDARVEPAKHRIDPGAAGDHRRFAGDHAGAGLAVLGDQLRGDIAATDVLGQRATNIGLDFASQVGEG
ncbi:hypothetical protein D3C71_1748770 [compost metagenome]